jgi:hypothetical protein
MAGGISIGGRMRKVVFIGSIAPVETAISYTGDGDGQRVKFDIPETQLGNAAGLLALRRRALQITVIDLGPIEEWQPGEGDYPIGDGEPASEGEGEPSQELAPAPKTYF